MPNRSELDARLDALQDALPNVASDEDADFDYLDFRPAPRPFCTAPHPKTPRMCVAASTTCWPAPG